LDWPSLILSLQLALGTLLVLMPLGIFVGRWLAWRHFKGKAWVQALFALPLVLPPTVLGFFLLYLFSNSSAAGRLYQSIAGQSLAFSFEGLLIASVIFNLPFAIQPVQRAFESLSIDIRDAAKCSGLTLTQQFFTIELPLVWPGILGACVLVFAHTLGEFGVVLMVGGNIPEETRTIAVSIYDSVQAFDNRSAAIMSFALLALSTVAIALVYSLSGRSSSAKPGF
jgi:molybdate transport system permease protein